jgi:hypothetical protein
MHLLLAFFIGLVGIVSFFSGAFILLVIILAPFMFIDALRYRIATGTGWAAKCTRFMIYCVRWFCTWLLMAAAFLLGVSLLGRSLFDASYPTDARPVAAGVPLVTIPPLLSWVFWVVRAYRRQLKAASAHSAEVAA